MSSFSRLNFVLFLSHVHYTSVSTIFIPIQNNGFEADGPLPPNTYQYGGAIISDWNEYDPSGIMINNGNIGIDVSGDTISSTCMNDPIFGGFTPEGDISAYVEQSRNLRKGNGEIGIYQLLTGYQVTEDTRYILTVYIGSGSSECCYSSFSTEGAACYDYSGFPGYRVQLLGDDTILSEDDNTLNIADGTWEKSTVTIDIHSGDNNIGKTLQIRLINKNIARDNSVSDTVDFDDVRLEAINIGTETTAFPTQLPSKQPINQVTNEAITTIAPNNADVTSLSPSNTLTQNPSYSPIILTTFSTNDMEISHTTNAIKYTETKYTETETYVNTNQIVSNTYIQDAKTAIWPQHMSIAAVVVGVLFGALCISVLYISYKCYHKKHNFNINEHMVEVNEQKNVIASHPDEETDKQEHNIIKVLFEHDLQLPQYYTAFIENGYDSIEAMTTIQTKEQLIDIGVTMNGHQNLILAKMKELCKSTKDGTILSTTLSTTNTESEDIGEKKRKLPDNQSKEMDERMKQERLMVEAWFTDVVGFARYKYHELFIKNGFESMKAIQAIKNKKELNEIGVTSLGHQALILSEIQKLNEMNRIDSLPIFALQDLPQSQPQAEIHVMALDEGENCDSDSDAFNPPGISSLYVSPKVHEAAKKDFMEQSTVVGSDAI